jgi:hypothetical protein
MSMVRSVLAELALELTFTLLALLFLGRGLLLSSRDSACLLAALALVLQGARLVISVERLIGKGPVYARQAAPAQDDEMGQDDGQRLDVVGRCESDGRGEARWASRASGRCMLCGEDGPGGQQASVATEEGSETTYDRFMPCLLCGSHRGFQRASAWAHDVIAAWRLPESPVQHALDEPPAAPANQTVRGRDVHRRRARKRDSSGSSTPRALRRDSKGQSMKA